MSREKRMTRKTMTKEQRALMLDIIGIINRQEKMDVEGMPAWFLDWPLWTAGENMPGCMPDSPYCLFFTERAARGYCRELRRESGGSEYVQDWNATTLRDWLAPAQVREIED
jgi:hypothetical protein